MFHEAPGPLGTIQRRQRGREANGCSHTGAAATAANGPNKAPSAAAAEIEEMKNARNNRATAGRSSTELGAMSEGHPRNRLRTPVVFEGPPAPLMRSNCGGAGRAERPEKNSLGVWKCWRGPMENSRRLRGLANPGSFKSNKRAGASCVPAGFCVRFFCGRHPTSRCFQPRLGHRRGRLASI